ncbi:YesL family protein [Paenibacillus kandeliae]|uniref:YesL family protein n=1 Tax=Paenibacillus kandeliae TaxID=3231269 RepID=UPI00345975E2
MEFRGVMGGLYRLSEWIMRLAGSNLLWVICSSPFLFFLVFRFIFMQSGASQNDILQTNWAMGILAPFVLFPATSALFTVVRKWVMGEGDVSVIKTFFRGYKENYKQSMIGGIFYTLLFVIMYVDYTVYMNQFPNLQLLGIVMLIFLLVLFVSLFNFFSMVAHYHMKLKDIIKNAILLSIVRPFRLFSTLLGTVALLFIGTRYPVLFLFFLSSAIAWFAFFNFYGMFLKMQEQSEKQAAEQQEKELQADEQLAIGDQSPEQSAQRIDSSAPSQPSMDQDVQKNLTDKSVTDNKERPS